MSSKAVFNMSRNGIKRRKNPIGRRILPITKLRMNMNAHRENACAICTPKNARALMTSSRNAEFMPVRIVHNVR